MTSAESREAAALIAAGKAILGCELGSTRIKASLVGPAGEPLASGSIGWENSYDDGIWTYPMEEVWQGLAAAFHELAADVKQQFGLELTNLAAGGFSAMMHGYIVVDKDDRLLVPFRTWRNNITGQASTELTALCDWAIPQRWSIAHLYQAILNGEAHVRKSPASTRWPDSFTGS